MSDPVRGKLNRVRFLGKSDSIVLTVKMGGGGGGEGERVGREHLQSTAIRARLVLESDLKHIGPDLLSCSIKRNRVRVDIRVRLKNIELDYPETGKHSFVHSPV